MDATNAVALSASGDRLFLPLYAAAKDGCAWVAAVIWKCRLYHSGAGGGGGVATCGSGSPAAPATPEITVRERNAAAVQARRSMQGGSSVGAGPSSGAAR